MAAPADRQRVAAVLDHVAELTGDGGIMSRARSAVQALAAVRDLPPDDLRTLAVKVAERVAPQLVPQFEEQSGVDLTEDQVESIVELVRRLDPEHAHELADDLREDPDPEMGQLESQLEQLKAERDAIASEIEEPVAPPEPEPKPEPEPERSIETPTASPPPPPATPRPDPIPVEELFAQAVDREGTDVVPRNPLATRVREARSNRERLATVLTAADELAAMGASGRRAVLTAIPDGWARRRALEALATDGVVDGEEAPSLLALLGGDGDRRLAASSLLAHGLVDPQDLVGIVDARLVARHRRSEV